MFHLLAFGIALSSPATEPKLLPPPQPIIVDGRVLRLASFFDKYQCPHPHYIRDYLHAADKYALDYRLLPAISVRESTCGQHTPSVTNHWGWDSARRGFKSVPEGIAYIAKRLAMGPAYENKPIIRKLEVYNPQPFYAREVQKLMREIDSHP